MDVVPVPAAHGEEEGTVVLWTLLCGSWGDGRPARGSAWLRALIKGIDDACTQEVVLLVGNYTS